MMINMIKNGILFILIMTLMLSFFDCKKSVETLDRWDPADCAVLKSAIFDLNSDLVQSEINKMLTDLEPNPTKDDAWGHEKNISVLIDRLNSHCDSITANLICYGCIKTLPPQTEILLTADSSGTMIHRVIDILTPDDDILQYIEIHIYYY